MMERRQLAKIRRWVVIFFCFLSAALMWPIYPFFSRIDPRVLGIPFSLVYLIILLFVSFGVLLGLFILEDRSGEVD